MSIPIYKAVVAAVMCAVSISGCASVYAPSVGTEVVDRSYKITGARWHNKTDITILAIRAYDANGMTAICGAYGYVGDYLEMPQLSKTLIESAKLYLDDDPILVGLRFATRHDKVDTILGKSANCIVTDVKWMPKFKDAKPNIRRSRKVINS
jgi:tRNA threonylcarbamoyladenosine modification (KEOPS) complex  Pcc1 subunit